MSKAIEDFDWDDALYEGEEIEDTHEGTWRWGEDRFRVFRYEGSEYGVAYRTQPHMGIADVNGEKPDVVPVKTIVTWETV